MRCYDMPAKRLLEASSRAARDRMVRLRSIGAATMLNGAVMRDSVPTYVKQGSPPDFRAVDTMSPREGWIRSATGRLLGPQKERHA